VKPEDDNYQTRDHIIPVSAKLKSRYKKLNIVMCCRKCNGVKSSYSVRQFRWLHFGDGEFYWEAHLGQRMDMCDDYEEMMDATEIAVKERVSFRIAKKTRRGRMIPKYLRCVCKAEECMCGLYRDTVSAQQPPRSEA
jgi:hypothetical protein